MALQQNDYDNFNPNDSQRILLPKHKWMEQKIKNIEVKIRKRVNSSELDNFDSIEDQAVPPPNNDNLFVLNSFSSPRDLETHKFGNLIHKEENKFQPENPDSLNIQMNTDPLEDIEAKEIQLIRKENRKQHLPTFTENDTLQFSPIRTIQRKSVSFSFIDSQRHYKNFFKAQSSDNIRRSKTQNVRERKKQNLVVNDQKKTSMQDFKFPVTQSLMSADKFVEILSPQHEKRRMTMIEIEENMRIYSNFYAETFPKDHRPPCIIFANQTGKIYFDLYITFTLLFITMVVPVRLAFGEDYETIAWLIIYSIIDFGFLLDMVFSFFTSYTDDLTNIEVIDHKRIAKHYFKGWFIVDFMSVIPLDYILFEQQQNVNSLFRFTKLIRIYKLVRLARMVKVFKLLKRNRLVLLVTEKLKINNALERLILFGCFLAMFIHVFSCLLIVISQIESGYYRTWIDYQDQIYGEIDGLDLYIFSVYFIVTTVATVGYGDINPRTTIERIFCVFIMIVGTCTFTFLSGALSSILQSYDTRQAELQEKLLHLNKLRLKTKLPQRLYAEIRSALNYDATNKSHELDYFINELPQHLKMELTLIIHKNVFETFPLFQDIGNKSYINWISNHLRPQVLNEGQCIYSEQDEIDGFYFMTKGLASFNLPKISNMIYAVIDPEQILQLSKMNMQVFQFFGVEDSVYNHLQLLMAYQDKSQNFKAYHRLESLLGKRNYQVHCIKQGECLKLEIHILDRMKKDFVTISRDFFRVMINQFITIYQYNKYCSLEFSSDWKAESHSERIAIPENFFKEQAFMLQNCSIHLNQLYKDKKIREDLGFTMLEQSDYFKNQSQSISGSSLQSSQKHTINEVPSEEEEESKSPFQRIQESFMQSSSTSQQITPKSPNVDTQFENNQTSPIESTPQFDYKKCTTATPKSHAVGQLNEGGFSSLIKKNNCAHDNRLFVSEYQKSKVNVKTLQLKDAALFRSEKRRQSSIFNQKNQQSDEQVNTYKMSKEGLTKALQSANGAKGHELLALVLKAALKEKVEKALGEKSKMVSNRTAYDQNTPLLKEFNSVLDFLEKNKHKILDNLMSEQKFLLGLNTPDQNEQNLKVVVEEMKRQFEATTKELKTTIQQNSEQLKELKQLSLQIMQNCRT